MTLGKFARSLSAGLIFGILAIALLPFLLVYNWAEMFGLIEMDSSPLFLLMTKWIGKPWKNESSLPEQTGESEQE
ncbi:hypothetical protein [Paenibacillus nasutitermitis]|uniref:Uncharacterized protein n=1 Tax=Paenibacillus nasutitermitis TaxID=1652958 RepID=A0A916YNE0_9BACL|nr:hypothetical protein [Paenibacillus nasutitermitis]GGD53635.1 hypothetical protein GCM10010911_08990 [Paenibacillus nasutitermitis]